MKIGFIGTGAISEAVITGLFRSHYPATEIIVSARGRETSSRLARAYESVRVSEDNQTIVDDADLVVLAVLPQIAEEVIKSLAFRSGQKVLSLIAAIGLEQQKEWIGVKVELVRAQPLPPVADLRGVIPIYPTNDFIEEMFAPLGTAIPAKTEEEFNVYGVAGAMMEIYFGTLEAATQWFCAKGIDYGNARACMAQLFLGLSMTASENPGKSYKELQTGHTTVGGLNEQLFQVFRENGGLSALEAAMDAVSDRLSG